MGTGPSYREKLSQIYHKDRLMNGLPPGVLLIDPEDEAEDSICFLDEEFAEGGHFEMEREDRLGHFKGRIAMVVAADKELAGQLLEGERPPVMVIGPWPTTEEGEVDVGALNNQVRSKIDEIYTNPGALDAEEITGEVVSEFLQSMDAWKESAKGSYLAEFILPGLEKATLLLENLRDQGTFRDGNEARTLRHALANDMALSFNVPDKGLVKQLRGLLFAFDCLVAAAQGRIFWPSVRTQIQMRKTVEDASEAAEKTGFSKVCIIDDDVSIRALFERVLGQEEGVKAVAIGDERGLAKLNQEMEVVVLDHNLGVATFLNNEGKKIGFGYQLIPRIRELCGEEVEIWVHSSDVGYPEVAKKYKNLGVKAKDLYIKGGGMKKVLKRIVPNKE